MVFANDIGEQISPEFKTLGKAMAWLLVYEGDIEKEGIFLMDRLTSESLMELLEWFDFYMCNTAERSY